MRAVYLFVAVSVIQGPIAVRTRADTVFPEDSGVVNVAEYGAVPDDGQDDTAAIQDALDDHPSGNHVFYFPTGEYRVSETLRPARDGGQTELLGALHVGAATQGPRFITEESRFSAAVVKGGTDLVQETRDGNTRSGRFGNADLYTVFGCHGLHSVYVDNADDEQVKVTGRWEPVASAPGGFVEHNFLRSKPESSGRVVFHLPVKRSGKYEVSLRWINQISSPIRYADNVPVKIVHANGTETVLVNQQQGGGKWNRIGAFDFVVGQEAKVVVVADNLAGHVQADAVRLRPLRGSALLPF